jgi:hypothetical protein
LSSDLGVTKIDQGCDENLAAKRIKRPPFYSADFFNTIKLTMVDRCIATMSAADWYRVILARNVTHAASANGIRLIPTKQETLHTDICWEELWRMSRLRGLAPDSKSFIWKLSANVTPVGERLFRLKKKLTPLCPKCGMTEDRHHLLSCPLGKEVSDGLKTCLTHAFSTYDPGKAAVSSKDIIFLQYEELGASALAATLLTSMTLELLYESVRTQTQTNKYRIQAKIREAIILLKKTNFNNTGIILEGWKHYFD